MINKTEQEIMKDWDSDISKPIVSICSTTYNHEKYIAQALDGFLMQETDFPFEILVRDDCSTDKTALIVKEYAEKYPALIKPMYEKENTYSKGVRPMATVMKKAIGQYIALCEGDDYWMDPKKLQVQKDFLENNKEYSLCYTAATVISDNGDILIENKTFGDSSEEELIAGLGYATTASVMFRIFDFGAYSSAKVTNGDNLLWHYLGFYGKSKCIDTLENTIYRIHNGGIWSGRSEKNKLIELLNTYNIIRQNIIVNCSQSPQILKMHDRIYGNIFLTFFYKAMKNFMFQEVIFGFKNLILLDTVSKYFLLKYMLKKTFKKLLFKFHREK